MGQLSWPWGGVLSLSLRLTLACQAHPRKGQLHASSLFSHLPASLPGKTSSIYILFPQDLREDPGSQKGVFH